MTRYIVEVNVKQIDEAETERRWDEQTRRQVQKETKPRNTRQIVHLVQESDSPTQAIDLAVAYLNISKEAMK